MEYFYFLTTVSEDNKINPRTWIFFTDLDKAKGCAKKSAAFYSECGYYDYIVIEKIQVDKAFSYDTKSLWYKIVEYKPNKYKTIKIKTPERYKRIVGWAIG